MAVRILISFLVIGGIAVIKVAVPGEKVGKRVDYKREAVIDQRQLPIIIAVDLLILIMITAQDQIVVAQAIGIFARKIRKQVPIEVQREIKYRISKCSGRGYRMREIL